jgi:hypothetical protein
MATITGTFNSLVSGSLSGVIGTPGPRGSQGIQGIQGPAGAAGAPGVGVPAGGLTGQYLVKISGVDFATGWQTLSLSGYLSLDGGEMNANAEITFEDTALGRVALASGSAFAVSSSSNPDLVSNVLYDRVFVKNATSQTSIIPTGVQFPDLTIQTTGFTGWNNVALTGVPTAPSAALGTDSTQIATTAFVQDAIIAGSAHAETLQAAVRNETGATLAAFTVVYITGASGNKATVSKAQANAEGTSSGTFGILETAIPNNQNGVAITAGVISGQNTTAFAEGAQLWLSPTVAGGVTSTKPSAPNHAVFIGVVTRVHATQGTVEVRIANGFELQELHNVSITSVADGDLLAYESATSLWKNKSFSTLGLLTSATAASTYYLQTNPSGFIGDAPSDGSQYARKNGAWDVVSGGGSYITSVTSPLSVTSGNLSVDLSAYLPSAGGTMTGQITGVGAGGIDTQMNNTWFRVGLSYPTTDFGKLEYNLLTIENASGNTRVTPTGVILPASGTITFGDATTQDTAGYPATNPSGFITGAPIDGNLYAQYNNNWTPFSPGIGDAPADGTTYGRNNNYWTSITPGLAAPMSYNAVWAYGNWYYANITTVTDGYGNYYNGLTF